jgi:hypothetical protein
MQALFEPSAGAVISPCTRYRYRLWRYWSGGDGICCFIMLNPSTADGERNDPTIRRCIDFARSWGFAGIEVVNLFAWRCTDPKELYKLADAQRIGPDNDAFIQNAATISRLMLAAWSAERVAVDRGRDVIQLVTRHADLHCLVLTGQKRPHHPLYLPRSTAPRIWHPRTGAHA